MIYLIILLFAGSIGLVTISLLQPASDKTAMSMAYLTQEMALSRPDKEGFSVLSSLGALTQICFKYVNQEKLERNLFTARTKLSALAFFGLKDISTLVTILLAFLFLKQRFHPGVVIVLAGIFGFLLPDFWLKTKLNHARENILRALPDVVDLLALCVGAGLDLMLAIKWVVDKSRPHPLIEELNLVLQEIKVGKPRKDALGDMAKRLDIPEISSFSRTLIQSEKMGVSVAEALKILSEDARMQRFRRGERIALKAPIKMLVPLIFFILPVVAIIVGAPVILQFMQSGIKF